MLDSFGQTPFQIFPSEHPKREILNLNSRKILEKVLKNSQNKLIIKFYIFITLNFLL